MSIELTEIYLISFKNWIRYLSRDIKILKIGNEGSEIMINISENRFFNFYFLNVHISLSMQVPKVKFCIGIVNIAIEGTFI